MKGKTMLKNQAISVLSLMPDDEPVFILRAQDVLAVPTIFKWVDLAKDYHVAHFKVENALEVAGEFLRYEGTKKIPD